MLACLSSASIIGVTGSEVRVEVHCSSGLSSFQMIGVHDAAQREVRDRIRAAVLSSGLDWPSCRITVAVHHETGFGQVRYSSALDLPIALGVLSASGTIDTKLVSSTIAALGELGLDGGVRRVAGLLCMADAILAPAGGDAESASESGSGVGRLLLPAGQEADLIANAEAVGSLRAAIEALAAPADGGAPRWTTPTPRPSKPIADGVDVAGLRIDERVLVGLEIAAAGGHNLVLVGPAGVGASRVAAALPGLLPAPTVEMVSVLDRVWSASGYEVGVGEWAHVPLRAPHHSASAVAVLGGGGAAMRPGEVSLAHGGVLLLDEINEYAPSIIDAIRTAQINGSQMMRVSRATGTVEFPADVQVVATIANCPGDHARRPCRCSDAALSRWRRRLRLDMFSMAINIDTPVEDRTGARFDSVHLRNRIEIARQRARERGVRSNARLCSELIEEHTGPEAIAPAARGLLVAEVAAGRISARGFDRARAVALTVADLDQSDTISIDHVRTAITFLPTGASVFGSIEDPS